MEEGTGRPRDPRGRFAPKAGAHGAGDVRTDAGITAPSIGPHTVIKREPPEQRLARHDVSEVDAMGKDKRRSVVGQTYGPTRVRQLTLYGIFLAIVVALFIGGRAVVNSADQPPATNQDLAPWSAPQAKQHTPPPIDFPHYGRQRGF